MREIPMIVDEVSDCASSRQHPGFRPAWCHPQCNEALRVPQLAVTDRAGRRYTIVPTILRRNAV